MLCAEEAPLCANRVRGIFQENNTEQQTQWNQQHTSEIRTKLSAGQLVPALFATGQIKKKEEEGISVNERGTKTIGLAFARRRRAA